MGFEIDFLAVGGGEKSGDAIALRWGNLSGSRAEQRILVIDGGTLEAGQNLVDHVKTYYKTDSVDAVVCTHPDIDHASGLKVVLEKVDFNVLLMHKPWDDNTAFRGGLPVRVFSVPRTFAGRSTSNVNRAG